MQNSDSMNGTSYIEMDNNPDRFCLNQSNMSKDVFLLYNTDRGGSARGYDLNLVAASSRPLGTRRHQTESRRSGFSENLVVRERDAETSYNTRQTT